MMDQIKVALLGTIAVLMAISIVVNGIWYLKGMEDGSRATIVAMQR